MQNNLLNRYTRGWYFVLPGLVVMLLIVAFPLGIAARFSLHDVFLYDFSNQWFVGLENYTRAWSDPLFINSVKVTLLFTLANTVGCLLVGLLVAFLLSGKRIRFKAGWMALFLLPFVMTPVIVGITWRLFMWEPDFGVINQLLGFFGITGPYWLTDSSTALFATALTNAWHLTPMAILVLYAALTTIPDDMYEAAKVDGAGAFQTLWYVVLPMIRAHILFVSIIIMTSAFREFDMVYTMTGGGPGRSTTVMSILAYNRGIANQDMGMANTIAFTMFMIMAVVAWLYIKVYKVNKEASA